MQTECSADLFGFAPVEGRKVVAAFDGGRMTSEAGALLLGATDGQLRLVERFAGCFTDCRAAELVEHTVARLVGQRVFGMALGYEDLIDHDQLRHDPVMAVLGGKLSAKRADCAPLAGKSTLNRLELSRPEPTRYHKISYDAAAVEGPEPDPFVEERLGDGLAQRQLGRGAEAGQQIGIDGDFLGAAVEGPEPAPFVDERLPTHRMEYDTALIAVYCREFCQLGVKTGSFLIQSSG